MYQNFSELLREAETAGVPLWKPILRNERVLTGRSEEEIFAKLESRYDIMRASAERALEQPLPTMGNLIDLRAGARTHPVGGGGGAQQHHGPSAHFRATGSNLVLVPLH